MLIRRRASIQSNPGPDLNAKLARASKSETSNGVKGTVCIRGTLRRAAAAATASGQYRIPDGDGMYGDQAMGTRPEGIKLGG